jgi:RNA polymerase sigma factor (sigma-70 family)
MADSYLLPAGVTQDVANAENAGARAANLMRAAWEGRQEALDELVAELTPDLWHTARAAGLSEPDAEDVVQTAWLNLMTHFHSIHSPLALKSWLLTTTRREAWRVRASVRRQRPADHEWLASIPDPDAGTEENVIIKDEQRELLAAFLTLPKRCQQLLRIVAFESRPDYHAVAAVLGMRRGSIGPTRSRCLDKLRMALEGKGDQ